MAKQLEMFVDTWKTRVYFAIIEKAKVRGCGETIHHILPKSLGGNNKKENLVALTHREHYIVHFLLTKMCKDKSGTYKMCAAFWRMNNSTHKEKQKVSSSVYSIARKMFSESQKGRKNYNKGGYKWTIEQRENARGKRPQVNQTGKNNNNFKGYYVTPWGTFDSYSEAHSKRTDKWFVLTPESLIRFCKNSSKILKTKNKYLPKLTKPEDYGFNFISKEQIVE